MFARRHSPSEVVRTRLAEGGEQARAVLSELFPNSIRLTPDVSGRYLWALFDADIAPLLTAEQRFAGCGFVNLDEVENSMVGGRYLLIYQTCA